MTSAAAGATAATDEVLRALADPARLRILRLLARETLCVCHLQDELALGQTLVSHHLRALRRAGLVEPEPSGRYVYYRLRPTALAAVRDLVDGLTESARLQPPRRPC